jgi:RNA polymerase sigma-70 factor (ECF subfamily)
MSESELHRQIEQHHQSAFGWALRCCDRRREEAQDVLHTAYVKVLDGRARFNGSSSFRTWLFALIRNTAADQRRSWLRRLRPEKEPPTSLTMSTSEQSFLQAEQAARIERALAELPARQREVLHLAFYQDMTLQEAAEVMSVSIGSARTHYERGKAKLRELLKET